MAISITASGRFGQMVKNAAVKKGVSLDKIAADLDVSYEHLRKTLTNKTGPSEDLRTKLCKYLDINNKEANHAVTCDSMERSYGVDEVWKLLGRDPRLAELEPLLPLLSRQEWDMLMTQVNGLVTERQRRHQVDGKSRK